MADGVHGLVDAMEPPVRDPEVDRTSPEPQLSKLGPRNHAVLGSRQLRNASVPRTFVRFSITVRDLRTSVGHGAIVAVESAPRARVRNDSVEGQAEAA